MQHDELYLMAYPASPDGYAGRAAASGPSKLWRSRATRTNVPLDFSNGPNSVAT